MTWAKERTKLNKQFSKNQGYWNRTKLVLNHDCLLLLGILH